MNAKELDLVNLIKLILLDNILNQLRTFHLEKIITHLEILLVMLKYSTIIIIIKNQITYQNSSTEIQMLTPETPQDK